MIKRISMLLMALIAISCCLYACSASSSSDIDGTYRLITVGNQGEYYSAEEAGMGDEMLTINGNDAFYVREMTIDKSTQTMTDPAGNIGHYTFDGKTLTLKSEAKSFYNEFIFEKQ